MSSEFHANLLPPKKYELNFFGEIVFCPARDSRKVVLEPVAETSSCHTIDFANVRRGIVPMNY